MGLLNDNEMGYNRSSVFPYLDRLRDKKYFVLHGTQVLSLGTPFIVLLLLCLIVVIVVFNCNYLIIIMPT